MHLNLSSTDLQEFESHSIDLIYLNNNELKTLDHFKSNESPNVSLT